jgi:menaquinone-specific isochorismate synthase
MTLGRRCLRARSRPSSTGLVSRTRPLSDVGDVSDLVDVLGVGGFAWLRDGGGLATAGAAARVTVGPGPGRLERAAAEVAGLLGAIEVDDPLSLPGTGPLAVGALPFADHVAGELVVPAVVIGRTRHGRAWITETGPADDVPAVGDRARRSRGGRTPTWVGVTGTDGRRAWTAAVDRALELIARGPLAKVVLAREVVVEADAPFAVGSVLDRLRRSQPSSFTYAAGEFVGASPELLVRRRGARVLSRPMAGTVRRGATADDDERLVAELVASPKEGEEHALVVGAVRAALDTVCREVVAATRPDTVRLDTVTHLATTVAGRLAAEEVASRPSALAVAGVLHPTPAVGGLPTVDALAAIAELESFERGLYAGPVGWVDARGDGDWAVALRCAQLEGCRAHLAAGAGIVADSDVDAEWAETEAKLEPMLEALTSA